MKVVYTWRETAYDSVKALVEAMLDNLPNFSVNQMAVEVSITSLSSRHREWISIRNIMELMVGREVSLKGGEFVLRGNV